MLRVYSTKSFPDYPVNFSKLIKRMLEEIVTGPNWHDWGTLSLYKIGLTFELYEYYMFTVSIFNGRIFAVLFFRHGSALEFYSVIEKRSIVIDKIFLLLFIVLTGGIIHRTWFTRWKKELWKCLLKLYRNTYGKGKWIELTFQYLITYKK